MVQPFALMMASHDFEASLFLQDQCLVRLTRAPAAAMDPVMRSLTVP